MTEKQKQWQLWLLGYYDGGIDGIRGRLTVEATKELQRAYGLTVDGIFGADTEKLSRDLITELQKALHTLLDAEIAIDGLAGMETSSAVARWQQREGQSVTGRADTVSLHQMLSMSKAQEPAYENWWDGVRYFARSEFRCRCGRYCDGFPAEPDRLLVEQAETVRAHFGVPVHVSSGVRCEQHNGNVGGAEGSRHKSGKAMDFRVEGQSAKTVLAYVKSLPAIRYAYAIDGSYVHMDVE